MWGGGEGGKEPWDSHNYQHCPALKELILFGSNDPVAVLTKWALLWFIVIRWPITRPVGIVVPVPTSSNPSLMFTPLFYRDPIYRCINITVYVSTNTDICGVPTKKMKKNHMTHMLTFWVWYIIDESCEHVVSKKENTDTDLYDMTYYIIF